MSFSQSRLFSGESKQISKNEAKISSSVSLMKISKDLMKQLDTFVKSPPSLWHATKANYFEYFYQRGIYVILLRGIEALANIPGYFSKKYQRQLSLILKENKLCKRVNLDATHLNSLNVVIRNKIKNEKKLSTQQMLIEVITILRNDSLQKYKTYSTKDELESSPFFSWSNKSYNELLNDGERGPESLKLLYKIIKDLQNSDLKLDLKNLVPINLGSKKPAVKESGIRFLYNNFKNEENKYSFLTTLSASSHGNPCIGNEDLDLGAKEVAEKNPSPKK